MDLFKPIDLYCERTSAEYWAEPLNAVSNLSIFLGGLITLIWLRSLVPAQRSRWTAVHGVMGMVTGIGSYLFHTHANAWSMAADVLPINILMATFLAFTFRRLVGLQPAKVAMVLAGFFVVGTLLAAFVPRDFLNGSHVYLHALVVMAYLSWRFWRARPWLGRMFLAAMLTFAVGLTFRSVDQIVCDTFASGTHFLWHTFNGVLIAILGRISVRHFRESS